MKVVIGIIMMVCGVFAGLYVGLWVCFIGGIVDVIEQVRADDIQAMAVAIGVAKVLFAAVAGWASGLLLVIPGYFMLSNS